MRVAFPRQDCLDDSYSGHTGDIADPVVALQVPLIYRLLHVLDVARSHLHQAVPMTKDRTHRADRLFRPERSAQQTYRMQILQPLTVGNIRFAPRHVLHVARVDQHDSETSRLQDLKKRNPVDSRRFHRHRLYVAGLQPIRSGVQVFGKRREMPYRLRIAIHRHGDINLRRPYVHTGSIRVQTMQHRRADLLAVLPLSRHGSPFETFCHARRPRLCRTEHSLERDRRTPVRSRRHHRLEHRVWNHAKKRAPEGCTIDHFGLLAGAHGPAHVIATKPPAQFLTWFDPRIAGCLLRSKKRNQRKEFFQCNNSANNLLSNSARSSQRRALWPRLRRWGNSRASSSRAMSTAGGAICPTRTARKTTTG